MLDPARGSGDFVSPADPDEHIFADVLLGGKLVRMVLVWRAAAADVVFVVCSGGGISMAVSPCAAVDLGVEALVMSPDFVSEQGFSPASSSSDLSLAVFSQRRLFGGRQRRRNKVLQTSLSFVGVCSGAGVGSEVLYRSCGGLLVVLLLLPLVRGATKVLRRARRLRSLPVISKRTRFWFDCRCRFVCTCLVRCECVQICILQACTNRYYSCMNPDERFKKKYYVLN